MFRWGNAQGVASIYYILLAASCTCPEGYGELFTAYGYLNL